MRKFIDELNKERKINFIKFPNYLKNKYQYFTNANISELKNLGYKKKIYSIESGINMFLKSLRK